MDDNSKKVIENACGGVSAAATGPVTIVTVAQGASSASAITSALATIGGGSMMVGVGVLGVASVAVFFGVRWAIHHLMGGEGNTPSIG